MSFRRIRFFCFFLCTLAARSQTLTLPYRPVTAEYSNALDRIIFIAANPNQLHIFDPMTNTDTAVNLPKPALSLSVSLDGQHAAVGHDALISYVNLAGAYLEKTLPANTTVNSLVLGNGYVYILTYSGGTEWIQISSGATGANGVYNGTSGRLHPSGAAIYTTEDGLGPEHLQDLNVSTGPVTNAAQGPYHGDYPVCGGVWFSPDGRRTYTGCATAYQAAPSDTSLSLICCGSGTLDTNADDLYWATLSGTSLIRSLTESALLRRVAAIPYSYQYASQQIKDNQVFLYDSNFLEPAGVLQLPDFVVNSNNYQAHGQQVFYNQAATMLYVVMQADGSSGLLNNFAVQIFPLSDPQACTATFSAASTTLPASGTAATVAIAAPATCIYQASSDSNWIQLVSGAYGSGTGTLTFVVRPNTGPQRTGDILLGAQSFAVTQPAAAIPENALTPLGYSVVGADYSKALDKVVLIASSPNELHIYDPVGGSDRIVPLPKPPFAVSVGPDGLSAAVGFDGWISIVNLSTAIVTSTIQSFTDVHTLLLANHGYIYAYPQRTWASLFSVQIATGAIDYATAIYDGRLPRLYADGNTFYTEGSKWDISKGPAALISGSASSVGCSPFWLTEDGSRMVTSCGKAYTTSPVPSLDLQYNGSFSNAASIQSAAESARWHSTAVIPSPGNGSISDNNADAFLQMYGDTYLGYTGDLSLPVFMIGSTPYAGRGRYVFWSSAEDKLIILEQADSSAKLAADYGATVYPITTPAAGCNYQLGAGYSGYDKNGGFNVVSVTTGAGCIWEAVSNASWISVNSGAVGFGSNTAGYTVAPNTGAAIRNGNLTIAGQKLTVTQAGTAPIPDLTITETHLGVFYRGQIGAMYTITVTNSGAAASSGTVNITETLPTGLTATAIAGVGWACDQPSGTCSRSDALAAAASYPSLTLTVNVLSNAPASVTCAVTVSGGGEVNTANDSASNPTTVSASPSSVGVFRSGFYWLEDVNGDQQFTMPPDRAFAFGGIAGDVAIAGDWNASGTTKVGIYRPSNGLFILDYNGDGVFEPGTDRVYNLGVGIDPTDIPVVGDWDGSGTTKVGLFRKGFFWILDYNGNGVFEQGIDKTYAFGGVSGDVPVVGDWNGNGTSKIGLFRQGFFWILDANGNGTIDNVNGTGGDQAFAFGGVSGDVPVVGDWNLTGTSKVGVFRLGFFWVLDANGNHSFDGSGPGQDLAFPFGGITGDIPVVGKW